MTLIVCLDPKGGMLFNKRRQTVDYDLCRQIGADFPDLYISPFSEKYFSGISCTVAKDPFAACSEVGAVFLEQGSAIEHLDEIDKLIIYRWENTYPADTYFDINPEVCGLKLKGKLKFSTEVHKNIVKEIYKR